MLFGFLTVWVKEVGMLKLLVLESRNLRMYVLQHDVVLVHLENAGVYMMTCPGCIVVVSC